MKKIILTLSVLFLAAVCSACYIHELDSSRNYRYYPPESETTYEKLLSATGGQGDKWNFTNNWTIIKVDKSADDTNTPKDSYIQVLNALEDLMNGITLYSLEQPADINDYNKYCEDLLDSKSSEYDLWANFGTMVTSNISDNDSYLYNLRIIILGAKKCYVIVDYKKNQDVDAKRYAYYSEDKQLISSLDKWADKYIELKSSAVNS